MKLKPDSTITNKFQDELSSLLTKVKDVISENETLTDKVKYGISNESSETDDTVETAVMKTSKFTATSGPNILFESRISELEAQLAQMNIDYRKLSEENNEMRRRISQGISGDGILDPKCSDAYKKQVENLQRDKNSLEDTVKKLQKQITDLKESDIKNFSKTQRNVDMAEQANFEKTQAEIEIRRLKVLIRIPPEFIEIIIKTLIFSRMSWNDSTLEYVRFNTR